MIKLTDLMIKNIKKSLSEKVNARGDGTLFFERRNRLIEAYYRYSFEGTRTKIKIDNYKLNNSGATLQEIREESRKLSGLKKSHPDLKSYLEQITTEEKINKQIKANTGTFKELLDNYSDSLSNADTKKTVENLFNKNVYKAFSDLKNKKASDITVDDIIRILKKIFDRGVTTGGNRLRSYLSSAFNLAVKDANDPLKQIKKYNIQVNPVVSIPTQSQFERITDRSLSHEEVKHLIVNIENTDKVSKIIAQAIKFLFYLAGQRPLQLLRATWNEYDYRQKHILITDTKGRGASRDYLTPLTPRALELLDELITEDMQYPFTTNGKTPIRVETLGEGIRKYCEAYKVEKFTLKDIRRTCKNLMIDAGINRDTRNLIQNHGLTGIDYKHYDKSDHLPEKLSGMAKYDKLLNSIINSEEDNDS